ncbi:MAG TPA: hypothetical protein VGQ99_04885 [Tepidisphaeraceae bacterium]|nr:hypothetical protein [Tepidisphaeraceae bacterium]
MTSEKLRDMIKAKQFRPFQMNLADGDSVRVVHPEFAILSPSGRTVVAFTPDDHMKIVNLLLVTSIEHVNGRGRSRTKKRRQR